MTIALQELEGSPSLVMDRSGGTKGTRLFLCDWTQINTLISELFPYPWDGFGPLALFPGFSWMIAHSAKFEPFDPQHPDGTGQAENIYSAGGCKVTVDYQWTEWKDGNHDKTRPDKNKTQPKDDNGNDVVLSWETAIGAEFLVLPTSAIKWANAAPGVGTTVSDDIHAGIVIPTIEHTLTRPWATSVPWQNIRTCVGSVNKGDFWGAPSECLLFAGVEAHREWDQFGLKTATLKYKFSEKNMGTQASPKGWNYFFRGPPVGDFDQLLRLDGNPIFNDANFLSLFASNVSP
jgi:hypothetical protein